MSKLLDLSNQVLAEKQAKILPENIKRGIQIFDITGTYDPTTSEGPKLQLFSTAEEMNDAGGLSGDIALVYKNEQSAFTSADRNIATDVIFPDTVTLSTAVTTTGLGTRVSIGTNLYISLTKTRCSIHTARTLGTTLASYTSTDGLTYTKTSGVDKYEGAVISTSTANYLAFFIKVDFNFEGLYSHDGTEWNYLDIGMAELTTDSLRAGIKAYGNNGVVEGDGSIYNTLPISAALTMLYGTDNVINEETASTSAIASNVEKHISSRLTSDVKNIVHLDTHIDEYNNFKPLYIKQGTITDRPVFDVLYAYPRLVSVDDYSNMVTADGKYVIDFSNTDKTVTINETTTITITNGEWYQSLLNNSFILGHNLYLFTHSGSTGYITNISLETGTTQVLTHTINGSVGCSTGGIGKIYDHENNRMYVSLSTHDNSSTSYMNIVELALDFSSAKLVKTVSITGVDLDGDMARVSTGEIAIEMKTGNTKEQKIYLFNPETWNETASCVYLWSSNGPLLMQSTTRVGELDYIIWHVDNMLYGCLYGYAMSLNLTTSTFTESSTAIDKDKFPIFYSSEENVLISDVYYTNTFTDELERTRYLYERATYDFTESLVTVDDIKYTSKEVRGETGMFDYVTDAGISPYFNGSEYKRVKVHEAVHQSGWWKQGTIQDYDMLLLPAKITGNSGVSVDNLYTEIGYPIEYIANEPV